MGTTWREAYWVLCLLCLLSGCQRTADEVAVPASEPSPPPPVMDTRLTAPPSFERKWDLNEPIIDSHVHIAPTMIALATSLESFERVGIGRFVIKSAGAIGTVRYAASLAMQRVMGERMRCFANLDWDGAHLPGFVPAQLELLRQAKADGMVGIKIFKNLGLSVRDESGALLMPDDPRLAPIFETCGELGLIVAWHIADPVAFFEKVEPSNERYDELSLAEGWSFHGEDYPSHAELMAVQERVIAAHPKTTFLLIHMGNYAENLDAVDALLDAYPNVYTDTSARVPEFGRHPAEKVQAFFIKHQDRILFGSDFIAGAEADLQLGSVWAGEGEPDIEDAVVFFERHWEYFETNRRQIEHPTPIQGRWKVDAIDLPPEVLRKLYLSNAERLLFERSALQPYSRPRFVRRSGTR